MTHETEAGRATDPDGRTVVLRAITFGHVLDGHPEMLDHVEAVSSSPHFHSPTIRRGGANDRPHRLP